MMTSLIPTPAERLNRARADLRLGLPVLIRGARETLLAASAETLEAGRLTAMAALGPLVLAVTDWRARTLRLEAPDGDLSRILLPAGAGPALVRALADPAAAPAPATSGTLAELQQGDAAPHRAAIRLAKSAQLLPAVVTVTVAGTEPSFCELTRIDAAMVEADALLAPVLHPVAAARVPMRLAAHGRLQVFRSGDGTDEHHAVHIGTADPDSAPLVRLHSACFTGDVLGSLKCDCGPQLHAATERMAAEGAGILLYLGQEGRGIGLANKMRAYALQDQGFDTVEANHRLGFEDDERDFRIGAQILKALGVTRVRLLTNNPKKVEMLTRCGIDVVERVPLVVGRGPQNAAYLDTKARKSGHLL